MGVALQMTDGTTRVLRMSEALERHLRQEWTSFVLSNAADVKGEDVLRILFYQDKKQTALLPVLDKALGDTAVVPDFPPKRKPPVSKIQETLHNFYADVWSMDRSGG